MQALRSCGQARSDALAALAVIDRLIETFPFVSPVDRAVALSAILSALDRRAMPTAPMHAFSSPTAGTGKSLLVDVIATLATSRLMPVISQARSEEEMGKCIGAELLAGKVAISIDNCEHPLQGGFLCQALTQQKINIRILGLSKTVETPANAMFFATGNNLQVGGDLARRVLLCSLDAHCENPEQRSFKTNAIEIARRDRGPLVAAALTVLRAWHAANEPSRLPAQKQPMGSFEEWSYRIREPLMWLGRADSCETIKEVKGSDLRRLALIAVHAQWRRELGTGSSYTVGQVVNRAAIVGEFHTALMNVAAPRTGNMVSNGGLGRWLKGVEGQIINGLALKMMGIRDGYPTWKLVVC